jgi:hypothetical protein
MRNNGKPLTNDECASIREMLHNGESHNSIAKKVCRAQSTISATQQVTPAPAPITQKGTKAPANYKQRVTPVTKQGKKVVVVKVLSPANPFSK